MVILDIVLMALVSVVIVSLLMWSICTQYATPAASTSASAAVYRSR